MKPTNEKSNTSAPSEPQVEDSKHRSDVTRRTALKAGSATIAGGVLGAGTHLAEAAKRRRRRKRDTEKQDFEDFVKGVRNRTPKSLRKKIVPFSVELPRLNAGYAVAQPIAAEAVPGEPHPEGFGTDPAVEPSDTAVQGVLGEPTVGYEVYHRLTRNTYGSIQDEFLPQPEGRPLTQEVAETNGYLDADGEPTLPTEVYEITMSKGHHEFIPGVQTPVYGYHAVTEDGGEYPFDFLGPTLMTNTGKPIVVRFVNDLGDVITSIHQHGGHNAREDDGYPSDVITPLNWENTLTADFMHHLLQEERGSCFVASPGFKEYYFPHLLPLKKNGTPDDAEAQSTMWYHDHAMDVTAENVWRGLAGFYINLGAVEENLVGQGVLPDRRSVYDVPLVIQDRSFQADGQFYYDNLDHNGTIGDLFIINGVIQPCMTVERRKYRFRFLNGSNARHYMLRTSGNRAPMVQIGHDSWLLPHAVATQGVLMSPGKRSDVVIDFTNVEEDEIYLENILLQDDGRGPKGSLGKEKTQTPGYPLVKFKLEGGPVPSNDCLVQDGDPLNDQIVPITDDEICCTREFKFSRSKGGWVVNGTFWNPMRNDTPGMVTGDAERWILKNGGGGWWHPIHIHLEGMQVQTVNGKPRSDVQAGLQDLVMLGGGDEAVIHMKFRTFEGPFAWHCHIVEHEDMRMMRNMNGTFDGEDGVLLPEQLTNPDIEVLGAPEDREPGASERN